MDMQFIAHKTSSLENTLLKCQIKGIFCYVHSCHMIRVQDKVSEKLLGKYEKVQILSNIKLLYLSYTQFLFDCSFLSCLKKKDQYSL